MTGAARAAVLGQSKRMRAGSRVAHLSALLSNASLVITLAEGFVEVLGYHGPLPLAMKLYKPAQTNV